MFACIIVGIVGISQYLDSDIVTKEFMQKLIIPKRYEHLVGTLKGSSKANQKVAGLIGNANYFSQYYALIFPIFFVLAVYLKDKKYKVISSVISALSAFLIVISLSETGLISILITIIIVISINIKGIINKIGIKRFKILSAFIILFLASDIILNGPIYTKTYYIFNNLKYEFTAGKEKKNIQEIELDNNKAKINYKNREINIIYDKGDIFIKDKNGKILHEEKNIENKNKIKDFKNMEIMIGFRKHKYVNRNMVYIRIGESIQFRMIIDNGNFKIINNAGKIIEQSKIKIAFGEGKEELLTGRIYIWSRAIPKIIERPLFGYGADTFELVFPNHDYAGLYKAYNRSMIIVDKPHNIYIGIASNTGILSLIAFLTINIIYLKNAIENIKKFGIKNEIEICSFGVLLSIISYLILGIMYDSNIVSTSYYYILLGIGINLNYTINKENKVVKNINIEIQ